MWCFTPGESAPNTHQIGGLVGPKASLNDMENPDPSVAQPISSHYTDYATIYNNDAYVKK
jgi:hypothetical protein